MLKKSIISLPMIGMVALAVASSGGGDHRSATGVQSGLLSLKSAPGVLQLKAGPNYTHNHLRGSAQYNFAMQRAVVTYRKGNTIYILPTCSKMPPKAQEFRSNLNLLQLKLQLHR